VGGGETSLRFRARPESHLAPFLVDTKSIGTDTAITFGAEAALVRGPLSFQAEYLRSTVNRPGGPNQSFSGFYGYVSWFLTGASRPYDKVAGVFRRVRPRRPLSLSGGGQGAVEVAVRYSLVDLTDGSTRGGTMDAGTIGLNWYWTPFLKTRFNWDIAGVSARSPSGVLQTFQTRFELDF
jgi:phosphate-selective porin OprO/OprP